MTQQYYNPFAGTTIVYPTEQGPDYQRYCQTSGKQSIDQSPFGRMVDMWFAALSIAVHEGLSPMDLSNKQTSNMTAGSIFDGSDSWRVQILMLLAIASEDDVSVVENPYRMIALANGLAAAGVALVVELLGDGQLAPIWNLTDALEATLSNDS